MRYLSLLVLMLALAGCYGRPYGHDGAYPYYGYGNYTYLGGGYPVTLAGRVACEVAGARPVHPSGDRLQDHQVLAYRLVGLPVALDLPGRQAGRLQARFLGHRPVGHLEPRLLVDRQVGRRALLCLPAVEVGLVGCQED
jgi:hypothetical protein